MVGGFHGRSEAAQPGLVDLVSTRSRPVDSQATKPLKQAAPGWIQPIRTTNRAEVRLAGDIGAETTANMVRSDELGDWQATQAREFFFDDTGRTEMRTAAG